MVVPNKKVGQKLVKNCILLNKLLHPVIFPFFQIISFDSAIAFFYILKTDFISISRAFEISFIIKNSFLNLKL